MYQFNYYAIPPLITVIFLLLLGFFVFSKNKKMLPNITFGLLCFAGAIWQFSFFMVFLSTTENIAIFWNRFAYLGISFITPTMYNFSISFLNLKKQKNFAYFFYILAIGFVFLSRSNYFIVGMKKYFWGYYATLGMLHNPFLLIWLIPAITAIFNLHKGSKSLNTPLERQRARYMFFALLISLAGILDYLPAYGIKIYPFGYIGVVVCLSIIAYAIVKYRLMDIRVAITRTGIFVGVYTLVLGLPFAIAVWAKGWLIEVFGPQWWMLPLGLMAALATVGPFIYIYISRRAEERLLKEQRRYQQTLKQASLGMTRIRNLRRLLDLITHIITKTVRISYAAVYLYDEQADKYVLQVSRDKGRISIPNLNPDNPLVAWIMVKREPLVYEEVKRQLEDTNDATYRHLEENMRLLNASVVIPSFLEDKFLGFIVLGDKLSGQIYTPDDLNVFQVLASQAALAIENAQFYEETQKMQEQIAQAEKMATIGTMADGLSHQINNRFYALSLIAGDTIDTIKVTDTSKCTPEVKEMIDSINHALERIQTNVMQGGEVVKGILKYTRKGDESFGALTLDQILDGTLEMVQYKVKLSEIDLIRNYPKDIPRIKGNLVQLQEAFFNFIDNAYDAIVERRTTLKEDGYRGRITVSAQQKDSALGIVVEDNGMGIKDDNLNKIFTPFFTTKTSARRGTGLGLYVIRRIITDTHKGKIALESSYGFGTRFILELPIAK